MGIQSWARTLAQGLTRRWLIGVASAGARLRHRWRATLETIHALPATIREQVRQWWGQTLDLPLEEQRALLAEFYERYEQLVELICDAAFSGTAEPFEAKYAELRPWLQRAYPHLRPYLIAHLNCDPSDESVGMQAMGKPADAFEALLCFDTLDALIRADQGDLIGRIERTRSALYRYGDYLREWLNHENE
jgi:hypothetical protein